MRKIGSSNALSSFSGKFHASKDPSMADESIHIEISGLVPDQKITLHSSVHLPNSSILECLAHYVADGNGYISLEKQESLGGDYKGVEPMGPFSFMRPSPLNKRKYERFMIKDPTKSFQIDFRVFNNFIPSREDESAKNRFQTQPHFTITRTYMAPGVKEIPVWNGNVRGTLYVPPGKGPFPGVISLSGAYPGAMKYKGALLASHGFTAIALKYFGEDDLPDNYISLEMDYIEEAVRFLMNHPSVEGSNGVGIISNCHGGRVALLAASVLPQGLIRCIVSISGWPFPIGIHFYKGKKITPALRPMVVCHPFNDDVLDLKLVYPLIAEPVNVVRSISANIFDFHDISYLFIAGNDDGYLETSSMISATKKLFEDAKHPDYEILCYKGAGHLIEHNYYPLSDIIWAGMEFNVVGGKQPDHSIAQNDSWPRILDFVRKRLCSVKPKL